MKTWHFLALGLVTVVSVIAQILGEPGHGAWSRIPGFWAVLGFVGCVLIIFVSTVIGQYIVQRREDYYDEP